MCFLFAVAGKEQNTVSWKQSYSVSKPDRWLLLSRQHRRKCYVFEVQEALTSATGTPSGGRQCNTIMPFRGTSVPWGSCSKFFLRSREENVQPALKSSNNSMKEHQNMHIIRFISCITFSPCANMDQKTDAFYENHTIGLKKNDLLRDNKISLVSKWHGIAYRRSGQLPCGSWTFPSDSRRHTGTSNPLGHGSPPLADVTRWSSPRGSSALQTRGLIA